MNNSTPSVLMTAQTVSVVAAPALLTNIMLHPGSAAAVITVYDNATAGSGTVLAVLQGVANGASVVFPFDGAPPRGNKGLTCVVSGTGVQAQIYYEPL